ncbi:MAG: TolC family protein, partial [Candidatus Marinimicrobia bacterium]|nr:TolC family protein [Candidatus Neomarinimicrobiota bacterium]
MYWKLFLLGIVIANPALSRSQLTELLTLEESIAVAMHKNFTVKTAEYSLQQRDAQVMGAYSAILPSVSINSGRSRFLQGVTSNIGNVQGIDKEGKPTIVSQVFTSPYFQRDNNSFGMTFRQNIYDGGRWWNNISRAKSFQTASFHGVEVAKNDAVYNTTQSYLDL